MMLVMVNRWYNDTAANDESNGDALYNYCNGNNNGSNSAADDNKDDDNDDHSCDSLVSIFQSWTINKSDWFNSYVL